MARTKAQKLALYWRDVRALARAAKIPPAKARAALKTARLGPKGHRLSRDQQFKTYRREKRAQARVLREYRKRKGPESAGWGGQPGTRSEADPAPITTSMVELYKLMAELSDHGFKIEYATPASSGELPPGTDPAAAEAEAREIRKALEEAHKRGDLVIPNFASYYWRVDAHFKVDVSMGTKTAAVLYI